jgi:hypothetical protein
MSHYSSKSPGKSYMQPTVQQLKHITVYAIGVILLAATATVSQVQLKAAERVQPGEKVCGAEIITGFGITDNREAYQVLQDVVTAASHLPRLAGLSAGHFDIRAANVDNVLACEDESSRVRYILYRPYWINRFMSGAGTNWAEKAIFAHELGHHVLNHFLRVKNIQQAPNQVKARLEEEADEFAGEVLAQMKVPLPQVLAAYEQPSLCIKEKDRAHPECKARKEAVTRGYKRTDFSDA